MDKLTLREIMKGLTEIDDITWGIYALSRDILRDRMDLSMKKEMIKKAIRCGTEKADEIIMRFGTNNPEQIARILHLKVEYSDQEQSANRILFALFTPPDKIQMMAEPVKRGGSCPEISRVLSEEQMYYLILGHEIFHFLEEEDPEIYTRTEKITLWRLFGYSSRSTIRALSEIAGMYFSKRLNGFYCSPFALDIILYYNYNSDESEKLYREVLRCRQEEV